MIESLPSIIIGGILMGSIYALIAMGLSLQYGVARVINLAHGEFIMIGAMLTWMLSTSFGVNPLLSVAIVGPFLLVIGFILHRTLFTSLRTKAPSQGAFEGSSLLIAFGFIFILQNIAILIWGGDVKAYSYLNFPVRFLGTTFAANRLVAFAFVIAIGVAFFFFLTRTRLGKAIRAAAQDPATAGLMGVNINWVLPLCFGLGAFLAGLAGVLLSMSRAISATMGLSYTIIALIVVALGGLGSIPGSFIGGFILGIIGSIVSFWQPALSMIVFYGIFLILLLVRPTGILGKK